MRRTLIHELNDLQAEHGYLRRQDLESLSRRTQRPLYEIQGLLSFYPHYRTEPARPFEVTLCRDMSCWLRDGRSQAESIEAALHGREDVRVRRVSCIGRCDCAPAATVNETPCRTVDVLDLIDGRPVPALDAPLQDWPTDPYDSPDERYGVFRRAREGGIPPDRILAALEESGLRGMGGAGFPTGLKWKLVAGEAARPKYVVCNADESEPGTFKDREILRQLPHLVLEGMLLGMLVVGAAEGIVFVRHEYGPEEHALVAELERARAAGIVGGDHDIEVFTSPGGYILGEETALLDCLEGRRGEPRNKPPFPGTVGLWGKPTLINNVETFHLVPAIVGRGVEWWSAQGIDDHAGLKFIAVSGHVERPGVYCVPMGTTVEDLIETCGGMQGRRELAAFAPGGASSNFLPADRSGVALDFASLQEAGSMLGSGALVAVAIGTDVLSLATNVLEFFANESCGKCVPCRVGSRKAVRILERALSADGDPHADWERTVTDLEETLRLTSICGLGQVALGPVMSVLRNFPVAERVGA